MARLLLGSVTVEPVRQLPLKVAQEALEPGKVGLDEVNVILLRPPPPPSLAYLVAGNVTVLPVAADSRAASRISVTTRLISSDERPSGWISPRTTAFR
jgi:hypothetical protein